MGKTSINYINKEEMMNELRLYNKTKNISEELGSMFLKIAKRYTSKTNFYGYSYRDDMISEAVLRMVEQIDKFDIHHPAANPFAYFTQTTHNQILALLKKEKRFRDIRSRLNETIWEDLCLEENLSNKKDTKEQIGQDVDREFLSNENECKSDYDND